MENKDTKSSQANRPQKNSYRPVVAPTKGFRPRGFRLGINPVILIASIFLLGFILFSTLNNENPANKISLGNLMENLKENEYAILNIRDDGTVVGVPKYIFRSVDDNGQNLDQVSGTNYINSNNKLKEVDLNTLYEQVKPRNVFENLFGAGNNNGLITEIIVGADYIVGVQGFSDYDHLIIKGVGKKDFETMLSSKGVTATDLAAEVSYITSAAKNVAFEDIATRNRNNQLAVVFQIGDELVARVKDNAVTNETADWDYLVTDGLAPFLQAQGINLASENFDLRFVTVPTVNWGDILSLIMILVAVFFAYFLLRSIQSGGSGLMKFGQSKARLFFGVKPDVTFKDVAGIDEAKEELIEIVEFLKNPNKFLKLGARIPKGVLMVGSPGTGKTLLARAIAGEAGVPFFHTSGSEFEEMLVGAGASRVRDLFDKAKKAAPALIFIDEIDAVARKRGTTIQSSSTEQTLNQILTEMDGFEKNANVIVIAATNRPDVLDPAILRPGRFDRRVVIDLPDIKGRLEILHIHAKNKPLDENVNLEKVAKRTVGFSGAELENTLNEAAIITAKDNRKKITSLDIEEAATKTTMGPAKKSKVRTAKEINLVAVHEAGHAVVSKYVQDSDPVHRVSIISRGMAGGVTHFLPQNDENIITRTKLYSRIIVSLGGRAAEDIVLKDITTGASSDIEQATSIARRMVQKFGMSDQLGLVKYGDSNELQYLGYGYGEQRDYSDETANLIDDEVRKIIAKAYKEALEILEKHRDKLDELVKLLLEHEVIESEEFDKLFD